MERSVCPKMGKNLIVAALDNKLSEGIGFSFCVSILSNWSIHWSDVDKNQHYRYTAFVLNLQNVFNAD